jgi:hypothetical protein
MIQQPSLPFSGRSATSRANSLQGAAHAAPWAGKQAQAVLRVIRDAGARGCTDWEIIVLSGVSRSSVCARRNALMDAGLVLEHPDTTQGTRVSGPWHRPCTVYVAWDAKRADESGMVCGKIDGARTCY